MKIAISVLRSKQDRIGRFTVTGAVKVRRPCRASSNRTNRIFRPWRTNKVKEDLLSLRMIYGADRLKHNNIAFCPGEKGPYKWMKTVTKQKVYTALIVSSTS